MKSIKQQYIDLNEGKMSQANFMRSLRMTMPHLVTNVTSFKDSVRILKNKGILSEADVKISSETADKLKKVIDSITADNSEFHRDGYTMGFFEGENPNQELNEERGMSFEEACAEAKQISEEEGVVQHVESIGNDRYIVSDWYDSDNTIRSYENGSRLDEASSMNGSEDSYDYQGKTVNIDPQSASKVGDIAKLYDQEQNEYNGEVVSVDSHTNMIHVDPNSIKPNGANAYLKEAKQNEKTGAYEQDGASMYKGFSEDTHVNRQELTKGIKMEHEQNPYEEYDKIVKKVIKNLKKDPNYYTHYQLSGIFDFKPTTIGGKGDGKPESHQMKPIDKENYIDKERGMKPVKDVEKVKVSSNKVHKEKHPNKIGKVELMSLVAQSIRGLQKMDATGEKSKKINVKEAHFMNNPADPNKYKIVKDSKGQIVKATNEDGVTFQKNEEAIAIDNGKKIKINGFIEQQTKVKAIYIVNNSGYTIDIDGLEKVSEFPIKGQMAEETREEQLQREIREIFDGRDNMSYTAGEMDENVDTESLFNVRLQDGTTYSNVKFTHPRVFTTKKGETVIIPKEANFQVFKA